MDGLSAVLSRIDQIEARFGGPAPTAGPSGFAAALAAFGSDRTPPGVPAPLMGAGRDGAASIGSASSASPPSTASGQAVAGDAMRYLGVPYLWGGTDPSSGLDCSGLVQRAYADMGVSLPRVAADQARQGQPVPSLAAAQPGDLIAFGDPAEHIGIYLGNGMMINAPHRGDVVRVDPVGQPTTIRRIVGANADPSAEATAGATPTPTVPYGTLFADAAAKYGVPVGLLTAVAQTESNFDPTAVSSAGAQGIMQIMPATAAGLGVDPLDPAQAIDGGARILASNLRQFGSPALAVAAYNAGGAAVARYGGVPPFPETTAYVAKVLGLAGMAV